MSITWTVSSPSGIQVEYPVEIDLGAFATL